MTLILKNKEGEAFAHIMPNVLVESSAETKVKLELPENDGVLAVMPNSGNHGYCRVVLSSEHVAYFNENLMTCPITQYDRSYMWRILADHVMQARFSANDFVRRVIKELVHETQGQLLPFILQKS